MLKQEQMPEGAWDCRPEEDSKTSHAGIIRIGFEGISQPCDHRRAPLFQNSIETLLLQKCNLGEWNCGVRTAEIPARNGLFCRRFKGLARAKKQDASERQIVLFEKIPKVVESPSLQLR